MVSLALFIPHASLTPIYAHANRKSRLSISKPRALALARPAPTKIWENVGVAANELILELSARIM